MGILTYTYDLCTTVVVQEAGGCLTKKNPAHWEVILPEGEAVFVDLGLLLVTFSYFFYCS